MMLEMYVGLSVLAFVLVVAAYLTKAQLPLILAMVLFGWLAVASWAVEYTVPVVTNTTVTANGNLTTINYEYNVESEIVADYRPLTYFYSAVGFLCLIFYVGYFLFHKE